MPPIACTGLSTGRMKYEVPESLENYLTAILRIENRNSKVRVKDIACELGLKNGSVVGALKKLDALGLVIYPAYRPINLTEDGRRLAEYISWRRGILVRFFMTVLHIEPEVAKASANRIGHGLKDEVIERMRRFMAETYANLAEPLDVW